MYSKRKHFKIIKNIFISALFVFGYEGSVVASSKKPEVVKRAPVKLVPPASKGPAKTAPKAPKEGKASAMKAVPSKLSVKKGSANAPKKNPSAKKGVVPKKVPGKLQGVSQQQPVKQAVPAKKAPGKPQAVLPPAPVKPAVPPIQPVVMGSDGFMKFQKNPVIAPLIFASLSDETWKDPCSNIYGKSPDHFSKAPKLHAYNSSSKELLCVQLPASLQRNLPKGVEYEPSVVLPTLNFVITTAERQNGNPHFDHLSLRPHYLLHADAPLADPPVYKKTALIHAAIFNGEGKNIGFDDLKPKAGVFVQTKVTTHPSQGDLVISPDNLRISGNQPGVTKSFFSSIYNDEKSPLSAVTYHWVLGAQDIDEVWHILNHTKTFQEFYQDIRRRWQGRAMVRELDDLLHGLY